MQYAVIVIPANPKAPIGLEQLLEQYGSPDVLTWTQADDPDDALQQIAELRRED